MLRFAVLLLALAACATTPSQMSKAPYDLDQHPPATPTAPVKSVDVFELGDLKPDPKFQGAPIDLEVSHVELRVILKALADVSHRNIVAADDAGGTISLRVKQLPWDQVLDVVVKTLNLRQEQVGESIVVRGSKA